MTDLNAPTPQLDIGQVLSKTFKVVGKAFPTLALLALIFTVLPQAALNYFVLTQMDPSATDPFQSLRYVFLAMPVLIIVAAIYQGATVHTATATLGGRNVSFGAALSTGARHLLPIIGLSIVLGVAITLGLVLLIVPGVFLMLIWSVTFPARVVENKGIFESMNRSRELTRGSRLMILLLAIILIAVSWVLGLIVGVAGVAISLMMGGVDGLSSPMAMWPSNVVLTPLLSGLTSIVGAVGVSVIYAELRRLKEGAESNNLAAVFD